MEGDTRMTIRFLDAEEDLRFGAALAGESRSEFVREAVRERAERLSKEMEAETDEEDR